MNPDIQVGTVTGTGAAIDIELGFVPDYVKIVNITDADIMHEWFASMDDGKAIATAAAVATLATNGITPYAGVRGSNSKGFTIGTTISESAKVLAYVAMRSGPGAQ